MLRVLSIAPRVMVYLSGVEPPPVPDGWIALAQIGRGADSPPVFGDGTHPTTRLCAAALDLLCRGRRPESVLDLGTETGILARIARARGVRLVVATDIDPAALACARANAELDSQATPIQFSTAEPDCLGQRFALVVANILSAPLQALTPALARALLPGGLLLMSGFTRFEIPQLRVRYEEFGFRTLRESTLDDWALVMFEGPNGARGGMIRPRHARKSATPRQMTRV